MRLEYRVDDKRFLEQMDAELVGWANPAERLHQALEKDEFTLFCQPILALTGAERYPLAEILVRLREEERALLPPGDSARIPAGTRLAAAAPVPPRFTVNL